MILRGSGWGVDEPQHIIAKSFDIYEFQSRGGVDSFEQVLAATDGDWSDQEMKLVNQAVLHQRGIEKTIPVLDDVAARLLFQVGHECGHIAFNDTGIPGGFSKEWSMPRTLGCCSFVR